MKKIFLLSLFIAACITGSFAQSTEQLHETAKSFMRQGDFSNAILVLSRSLQQEPGNIGIAKDLALSYYYQKNNVKALETIKPILDLNDADDQCFQIAGDIYKQLEQKKECEKVYKKGLKKFPQSGPLYNELGELQFAEKNYDDAIKSWEKGIQTDPSYSRNYFNAARYYFFTKDKVWSILYGEIFVNMEPTGNRTTEAKQLLLGSYKKLFAEADLEKNNTDKNPFVKNYLEVMNKESDVLSGGITLESLSMVRTRFIIDWFASGKRPVFRLFDYQQQLLKEGMFEAYNQWLFGAVQNPPAYENWVKTHSAENAAFSALQKARIFKVPAGQYYK